MGNFSGGSDYFFVPKPNDMQDRGDIYDSEGNYVGYVDNIHSLWLLPGDNIYRMNPDLLYREKFNEAVKKAKESKPEYTGHDIW